MEQRDGISFRIRATNLKWIGVAIRREDILEVGEEESRDLFARIEQ